MQNLQRHHLVTLSGFQSFLALIFCALQLSQLQKVDCPHVHNLGAASIAGLVFAVIFLCCIPVIARYYWMEDRDDISPFAHLGNEHIEGGDDDDDDAFS